MTPRHELELADYWADVDYEDSASIGIATKHSFVAISAHINDNSCTTNDKRISSLELSRTWFRAIFWAGTGLTGLGLTIWGILATMGV